MAHIGAYRGVTRKMENRMDNIIKNEMDTCII